MGFFDIFKRTEYGKYYDVKKNEEKTLYSDGKTEIKNYSEIGNRVIKYLQFYDDFVFKYFSFGIVHMSRENFCLSFNNNPTEKSVNVIVNLISYKLEEKDGLDFIDQIANNRYSYYSRNSEEKEYENFKKALFNLEFKKDN